jgi:hypothetical protein
MTALVGIGAGLVSALLFAVVITGSPLAMFLSYVAPLPVFIAAMGWRHQAGIIATVAGMVAIAVLVRPYFGVAFVLAAAGPAWLIAYLALLGRTHKDGTQEWFPLNRLLMWIIITASVVTLAMTVVAHSDIDGYRAAMRRIADFMTTTANGKAMVTLPRGINTEDLAGILEYVLPFGMGSGFVYFTSVNLWLAAKITKLSGRLVRPWPYLPDLRIPREMLMVGAVALALAVILPGFGRIHAMALLGALVAGGSIAGLSTIHAITVGKTARGTILAGVYALLIIGMTVVLPLLAMFGLFDAMLDFRRRFGAAAPPSPLPPSGPPSPWA